MLLVVVICGWSVVVELGRVVGEACVWERVY